VIGMLEYWNDGFGGIALLKIKTASAFNTQYSILPLFHYSLGNK
jgi:hypothetical protein